MSQLAVLVVCKTEYDAKSRRRRVQIGFLRNVKKRRSKIRSRRKIKYLKSDRRVPTQRYNYEIKNKINSRYLSMA